MWTVSINYRGVERRLRGLVRSYSPAVSAQKVVHSLQNRGLISQSTKVRDHPPPPGSAVYVGFDPTADSLHVGNLIAILSLLHFKSHGYRPIAVIGGATGLVGDPSGRTNERDKLQTETLSANLKGLKENLSRIFNNYVYEHKYAMKSSTPIKILNNADWWSKVTAVEFVSDIARHFRLSAMLAKESVKQRLPTEEGMSCAEFLYPIFQAYDFLHLYRQHNCWMQLGGGDQWGNITAGCDFIKRATGSIVHGVTLPLLTTASGEKLGKSMGNAVWLSPAKTSPYEFYQFFVRTTDQDVERFLKYFTFLPLEEIEQIMEWHKAAPEKFTAQKCLARDVTELVHGGEGLKQALNATEIFFGNTEALHNLSGEELLQLFHDAPTTKLPLSMLSSSDGDGLTVVDLAVQSGAVKSKYHAESLVARGGLYVNSVRVEGATERVCTDRHLLGGAITILRIGKKNYTLVKWTA